MRRGPKRLSVTARIERRIAIDRETGCWNWTGQADSNGYGHMLITAEDGRRLGMKRVHRLMALIVFGEESVGDWNVLHRCDNPRCCNPSHLFLGTQADNMEDAARKGRIVVLRGLANPRAKISDEQAAEVRRRRIAGEEIRPLASEFGISETLVFNIATGRNRRHA